ncbi:glycosyltransferase [Pluralibacter gergoviae]|uniref:glycosyltransferase n=1 Tax=Pluralibacter gergoviae TaxID=61647 RepID=UPI0009082676|nr:glycosyltransferase [Pluralibacter gergoviae]EKW9964755.1 glycosyltransferase [Pluralibacter gergoviae]ELD4299533.1 glycosyltransferase [Pluralibacter gergoviae]ELN2738051.1 glycosyltransferase [Pluralibacter gergoviae]
MNYVALIVTFNRLEKLKNTISKTLALDFKNIVIVNNGSSDGTADWLCQFLDSRINIINLDTNRGGAGGFKIGSEYICNNIQADWVFFYDDDAFPEHNALENFSNIQKGECRVFACLVKDLDGNICQMNLPFTKVPSSLWQNLNYIFRPQKFVPVDYNDHCQIQTVSFVGMIIHNNLLRENLNNIHEELFIYFDDFYFGYHLYLNGETILYTSKVIFRHDVSIQGKVILPTWKVYYLIRNMILSRKFFSDSSLFSTSSIVLRVIKYLLMFPWQREKISYIKFLYRGVVHGIKGFAGKYH